MGRIAYNEGKTDIRDFYVSYYKYNLTEEQIDTILRVRLNEQSR